MDKNPLVADPLQTIQVSERNDRLTYVSSILKPNETQNIEETLQQN